MEKESILLPGMAEREPTEKSPLSPQAFTGAQPRAQYQGKGFCKLLQKTQKHALTFNTVLIDEDLPGSGACGVVLGLLSYILILLFFPFSLLFTIKVSWIYMFPIDCVTNCYSFIDCYRI